MCDVEGGHVSLVQVYEADPVNRLKLTAYFRQKLNEAGSVHGAAFNAAISSVDQSLLEQVKAVAGG